MNREEMIGELKKTDLRAIPTVITMDMGLEYDYATTEGAGSGFGGMGNWPMHMFGPIEKEQWMKIREAINDKTLEISDLKGTGLVGFLVQVKTINYEINPTEILKGLTSLPEDQTNVFYCFFDTGLWYDGTEKPEFYTSEKELKEKFIDHYVSDLTRWEEMNDDELKHWYGRLQNEMEVLPICTYDEKKPEIVFAFELKDARGMLYSRIIIQDGSDGAFVQYYAGTKTHRFAPEDERSLRIGRADLRRIKTILDDDRLFETTELEPPFETECLDGCIQQFEVSSFGRRINATGYNIELCQEDTKHCLHSVLMARALERIREILLPLDVPQGCLMLSR